MSIDSTRRGFLKGTAALSATLIVGLRPDGSLAAGADATMLSPFVRIDADGTVTAIVKHFEKGQGPATGLTTLIAEELGVSMEDIQYEFAPSNPALYANTAFGSFQGTGGSTAMANSFLQYRQAGAAARAVLLDAAAQTWGVDASTLDIADGRITDGTTTVSLGEFVALAATLTAPADPALKDPADFILIGNPDVRRKDSAPKIDGTARFAMDVVLDNQMVVVIARTPRMGGTVARIDDSAAQAVKGFVMAKPLPTQAGVAVYAEHTWAAFQARDALDITWGFSAAEARSSADIKTELMAGLEGDAQFAAGGGDIAATRAAIEGAAQVVEQTYYFPLLAHAPMEPLTCTLEPTADGGVILHDGAQFPTGPHGALAQILDLPMEKVQINTMFAGGSFGRRATPEADYQVECALAFAMTDRTRPVKLVWSREDDITGGYYRPAFAHKVRVGLDDAGEIVGWDHRIAGQSIMKGTFFESFMVHDGVDHTSVEGVPDTPYAIPGMAVGLTDVKPATRTLWWRAVGHTHTAYVMETMMDAVARAVRRDPVELRLSHLSSGTPDATRMANVLQLVAEKAGWGNPANEYMQGVAVHKSFGSYVAEVVDVSKDADGAVQVETVTCAVDCGIAVNPDVIRAQMEGGIGYGIGHAIRNEITLDGGAVEQSNFRDYEPMRMREIKAIDVHIVTSTEAPTGVGEPGTPPAAPALANAIAKDGPRITELPMSQAVDFA